MKIYSSSPSQRTLELDLSNNELLTVTELPSSSELVIAEREVTAAEAYKKVEQKGANRQAWRVFGTTFVTIFLAELGDKTQVSTLLMTAEFHKPWIVFAGAASALVTTSLLGVLVGRWLSARLSARTLDTAAGITLALIAVWLLWDVVLMQAACG